MELVQYIEPQRDRQIQYRANLHAFYELTIRNRNDFSDASIFRLQQSPFWVIIDYFYLGIVEPNDLKKSDEDITRMVRLYDVQEKAFQIGESLRKIEVDDVHILLGLPNTGITPNLKQHQNKPENNNIINKYFGNTSKVTKQQVNKALKRALEEKNNQDSYEVASLVIMNLFITFLFCTSGSTLSWKLVEISTKLISLRSYNWSAMILEHLTHGLSKKKDNKDVAISGCVLLIMYWLAEKTGICERLEKARKLMPTFVQWSLVKIHKSLVALTDSELEGKFREKEQRDGIQLVLQIIKTQPEGVEEAQGGGIEEEDFVTPTFEAWTTTNNEKIQKQGETAQKRMKEIIDSLEESSTQPSLTQQEAEKTQALLKQLSQENEKLEKQNKLFSELLNKTYQDYNVGARKIEILKEKLMKKWKNWKKIESERNEFEAVVKHQIDKIEMLEDRLIKAEKELWKRKVTDSNEEMEFEDDQGEKERETQAEEEEEEEDGDDDEEQPIKKRRTEKAAAKKPVEKKKAPPVKLAEKKKTPPKPAAKTPTPKTGKDTS